LSVDPTIIKIGCDEVYKAGSVVCRYACGTKIVKQKLIRKQVLRRHEKVITKSSSVHQVDIVIETDAKALITSDGGAIFVAVKRFSAGAFK